MPDAPDHRLPTTVSPTRYDLELAPDLATATFHGSVAITLEVHERTDALVCNAIELEIVEAWADVDGRRVDLDPTLDEGREQLVLRSSTPFERGTIVVHVSFRGILNDKLRGFYRSTFTDPAGATRAIAVTQFEATDARRAFPCWDEPVFKAVFGVTLAVDEGLVAVSNGPELSRTEAVDGRVRVTFADTMPMSTYLVAFVVGPLETTRTVDVDGTPLRIVFRPGQADLAEFALEVSAFALRYLADYYGIVYPGDKMDMVAVPDFAFGAMENLGCVIYRENLLLIDPAVATQSELQAVVDVIAHELAHMWFGDLVTMSWWNGIWLNEAFATFMEIKCTDAFRPEWQRWMHFGRERSVAFDVDALASTRAIEYPVITPADAEGMFDVLTYQKGSAVVRMLEQYLGEDAFRDGIRRYLQTHQFGNTETEDLWNALEAETGEPVRAMMDTWIFQGGHPVIDVSATSDGASVTLGQERFSYLGGVEERRWDVPVVLRTGETEDRLVLDSTDATRRRHGDVVVANAGGHGFYRVAYDADLHDRIVAAYPDLAPLERYVLVDDMVGLVLAGRRPAADLADLVARLSAVEEDDLAIWQSAAGAIDLLHRAVDPEDREALSAWVRSVLRPVGLRLGNDAAPDDDDRRRALRGMVLGILGVHGDDDAIARSHEIFTAASRDTSSIDAELAAGALRSVAAHADPDAFAAILDRFRRAETTQEQFRSLYAAAGVEDPALFTNYLEVIETDEVRSQNLAFAYRAALRNDTHAALAWEAITQQWGRIRDRLPFNAVHRLVEGVSTVSDADLAGRVHAFLDEQDLPEASTLVDQHVERMDVQVALRAREAPRLLRDLH